MVTILPSCVVCCSRNLWNRSYQPHLVWHTSHTSLAGTGTGVRTGAWGWRERQNPDRTMLHFFQPGESTSAWLVAISTTSDPDDGFIYLYVYTPPLLPSPPPALRLLLFHSRARSALTQTSIKPRMTYGGHRDRPPLPRFRERKQALSAPEAGRAVCCDRVDCTAPCPPDKMMSLLNHQHT